MKSYKELEEKYWALYRKKHPQQHCPKHGWAVDRCDSCVDDARKDAEQKLWQEYKDFVKRLRKKRAGLTQPSAAIIMFETERKTHEA